MKRLCSSDSLGGLMSICQTSTDEHNQGNNHVYSREFQSMLEGLDEEGCVEESGYMPSEKKRRLSLNQVKALEKNFEVENKLEPDRKVKLAQELGLQPRQVAVWFQNRRARWKTKQLERDYGILKANYDALKHNFEKLQHDNHVLIQEFGELKSKLQDDKDESNVSIKEDEMASEKEKSPVDHVIAEYDEEEEEEEEEETELNFQSFNSNNGLMGAKLFTDFKDGLSDSDSSGILNEDNNNNGFQFSDSKAAILGNDDDDVQKASYQPQFVKIEEHNFFGGDESCSTFFSDDQPPSLHWDCPEEWN